MVNLLYTEMLKLKRAKMFLVSVIGASAAPIMMFIGFLNMKSQQPDTAITFELSFYNTNMYILLLIGNLLYGVITAFLFNREFTEDTLKNLLTIPVSRTGLIVSKMVMLFLWIMALTLVAWGLTFVLALVGQFEGLSTGVLLQSLKQYTLGAGLLFLLSTPTMFVTFLFKNYVPTIIFTSVITMINVALADKKYSALFPWSAAHVIGDHAFFPEYPPSYSYLAIIITSIAGFTATVLYFRKADIH
ncbi:ABC transporter permease [Paenibacillus sp. SAFN-117]|uniref:ABC transporter permease n=1 Tax=Paenibacillus sp. SAFN-117 TaxID=3436860 RepID=UPI003F81D9B4